MSSNTRTGQRRVFIRFHCIEKLYRRMTVRDDVHIRIHFRNFKSLADEEYIRIAVLDDENIGSYGA